MKLDRLPPELRVIKEVTFPDYTGKKFEVLPLSKAPKDLSSYWEGGSRNYYALYNLNTGEALSVGTRHPFFEADKPVPYVSRYPENIVLVEHVIFQGKDLGLTFYIHENHLRGLLPEPIIELSDLELAVLTIIDWYVSSSRLYEAERKGISPSMYESAKQSLIAKGLLNRRGAITTKGENVVSAMSERVKAMGFY
jgi:hypothetical protein